MWPILRCNFRFWSEFRMQMSNCCKRSFPSRRRTETIKQKANGQSADDATTYAASTFTCSVYCTLCITIQGQTVPTDLINLCAYQLPGFGQGSVQGAQMTQQPQTKVLSVFSELRNALTRRSALCRGHPSHCATPRLWLPVNCLQRGQPPRLVCTAQLASHKSEISWSNLPSASDWGNHAESLLIWLQFDYNPNQCGPIKHLLSRHDRQGPFRLRLFRKKLESRL